MTNLTKFKLKTLVTKGIYTKIEDKNLDESKLKKLKIKVGIFKKTKNVFNFILKYYKKKLIKDIV